MPIEDKNSKNSKNSLTEKNKALLNWILCESGVHNIIFDPKECTRLFNVYQKICRDEE